MLLTPVVLVFGGVLLLWFAAEGLVRGAATLGRRAGISPIVIGLTVVSIGTSAPELAVCVLASLRGSPDLAVGNVFGSNLANVGLVLGLAATFRPLPMRSQVVRREVPWMIAVTVIVVPFFWNLHIGRLEGSLLLALLFAYLYLLAVLIRREPKAVPIPVGEVVRPDNGVETDSDEVRRSMAGLHPFVLPGSLILLGSLGLIAGGQAIVMGATDLAEAMGVSEMVIGLSVVAVGTSLPELATTVVAAVRDEADLAVGNIVGSNIFNFTFVLGGTALVAPITVSADLLRVEYVAVLVLSLALLPLAWSQRYLARAEGLLLLGLYGGAWYWILSA